MKIKEILELSLTKNVAAIAKDHLTIGEKQLREILKAVGCEQNKGKKGWTYIGDTPSILDSSIYEFVVQPTKGRANVTTKEPTNQHSNDILERFRHSVESTKKQVASTKEQMNGVMSEPKNEPTAIIRKRSSFDIDVELMKQLKIQAILDDRNVYEIVETAIRKYLAELKR